MDTPAITWDGKRLTVVPSFWLDRLDSKAEQVKCYPPVITDLQVATFNKHRILAVTFLGERSLGELFISKLRGSDHNYTTIKSLLEGCDIGTKQCTLMLLTTANCYRVTVKGTSIRTVNVTEKYDVLSDDIRPIKHILLRRGGGVLAAAYHLVKFNSDHHSRLVVEDHNGEARVRHLGYVGFLEKIHLAYLLGKSRIFKPVRDFA